MRPDPGAVAVAGLLGAALTGTEPPPLDGVASDDLLAAVDWHDLHGVAASTGLPGAPPALRAANAGEAALRTARTTVLLAELERISAALDDEGVAALALKGAALHQTVYRERVAWRPMSDLDLLVAEPDLATAQRIVEGLGYRTGRGRTSRSLDQMRSTHRHLPMLVSADGIVGVELHRHVLTPSLRDSWSADELWAGSTPSGLRGLALPSATVLAVHLAVHFGGDRKWTSRAALRQLADLWLVVASGEVDWDGVERHALGPLGPSLAAAFGSLDRALPPCGVPDPVLARLRAAAPEMSSVVDDLVDSRVLHVGERLPVELLAPRKRPVERLLHRVGEPSGVRGLLARAGRATGLLARELANPLAAARQVRVTRALRRTAVD